MAKKRTSEDVPPTNDPKRQKIVPNKKKKSAKDTEPEKVTSENVATDNVASEKTTISTAPTSPFLKKQMKKFSDYPDLIVRASPNILIKVLPELNSAQKKAIEDLGFMHIFNLRIGEIPGKIAFWCLNAFDSRSCSLIVPRQKGEFESIHITEKDVWLIFGFPKGPNRVRRKTKIDNDVLLKEWESKFSRKKHKIRPIDVVEMMKNETDGGDWFKRHFMVLVEHCIYENAADGYIRPKIMSNLHDLSKVKNFNWCHYMLVSLIRQRDNWEKRNTICFIGPILLPILFFVDRVELYIRFIERKYPLMCEWTSSLLRARQKGEIDTGGFGFGHITERFDPGETETKQETMKMSDADLYTDQIIDAAKEMAESMSTLISLIKNAPEDFKDDISFKIAVETSRNLIGVSPPISVSSASTSCSLASQPSSSGEEWSNPVWIGRLERIMQAIDEKCALHETIPPNFKVVFSQDQENGGNDGVNDAANDADLNEETEMRTPEAEPEADDDFQETDITASKELPDHETNIISNVMKELGKHFPDVEDEQDDQPIATMVENVKGKNKTEGKAEKPKRQPEPLHVMVKRSTNERRRPARLMSPINERAIKITESLTLKEKEIFCWAVASKNPPPSDIVYADGNASIMKSHLKSLKPNEYVLTSIIDAWSSFLNKEEKQRDTPTICRIFFSTFPCCYTVVDPNKSWSKEKIVKVFNERIEEELINITENKIRNSELVFFPICHSNHFYVISFNLRKMQVFIIDNSSVADDQELSVKYGKVPETLVEYFCNFLMKIKLKIKADGIKKASIERLKMKWRNETNKIDCGVYTMIHMETYMGTSLNEWKVDLKEDSKKQLNIMRAKYCCALLSSDYNTKRSRITELAKDHYKKMKVGEKKIIDKLFD